MESGIYRRYIHGLEKSAKRSIDGKNALRNIHAFEKDKKMPPWTCEKQEDTLIDDREKALRYNHGLR
jgi:hypothetical protein